MENRKDKLKDKSKTFFGAVMILFIIVGAIVGVTYNQQITHIIDDEDDVDVTPVYQDRNWGFPPVGDHNFNDTDEVGFCYGMAYPHSADPNNDYAVNLSNATAYEFSDDLNGTMAGETPYDTAFDFVCKYRLTPTFAYDSVNGTWRLDWIRGYFDADFSSATDFNNVAVTVVNITANENYIWVHIYIQDIDGGTGDGFQITHNEDYTFFPLLEVYY